MATASRLPVQVFPPVPAGRRVRRVELLTLAAVLLFTGLHLGLIILLQDLLDNRFVWALLGLGICLVAGIWFGARIKSYRVEGSELVVDRVFLPVRIPLSQYTLVHEFRGRVGAIEKIIGNDGLGAISGHFESVEHGNLSIYATDLEHSILLEGPSEKLIVSPSDPAAFIEAVLFYLYPRAS